MMALHNFAKLAEHPNWQVLVCSSARAAEAAQQRLGSGVITTAWTDGLDHTDWSALQGRSVGLLAGPGLEEALVAAISPFASTIKAIDRPADAGPGWTLADAPEDFSLKGSARTVYTAPQAAVQGDAGKLSAANTQGPTEPADAPAGPSTPARSVRKPDIDFAGLIGRVAQHLLGEPNAKLSSQTELRYGAKGSLSVDLVKGVWHCHETGGGGGLFDLIVHKNEARNHADAAGWLEQRGFSPQPVVQLAARKPDDAANKLRRIRETFLNCDAAGPEQDYIVRKQGSVEGLRVVSWPMQGWGPFRGRSMLGWLAVPAYSEVGNAGDLMAVQYIGPGKGEKLNSASEIGGATFTVGDFAPGEIVYIVEGIGHAWSLNEVTGSAAAVSFSAGNIKVVAAKVKAAGGIPMIVPDRGQEAAAASTAASLGCWHAPLPDDLADGADVNDLHHQRGADAVRAVLNAAIAPQAQIPDGAPAEYDGTTFFNPSLDGYGEPRTKLPPFAFTRVGDMLDHLKPTDWLIKGYVEADSLALLFSDPGVGKSFMAIDIACCIATGRPWHDNAAAKGAVFMIAGEGHNGLVRRFKAWEIANGVSLARAPLYVSHKAAAFCDAENAKSVIEAVRALAVEAGEQPRLIVVDTVARNFGSGDENSTKDMGEFIQHIDELKHEFKATVLLVHHSGHGDKSRARGSMALKGALDAEYRLERDDADKVIRFEATKMKDAEAPPPLSFRLEGIKLPLVDGDGNVVFGAAIRPAAHTEKLVPGKKSGGKNQTLGRRILLELEREHRATLEADRRDPGEARVHEDSWRERLDQSGLPRSRFHEVKRSLIKDGSILFDGLYVRSA